MPRQRRRLAGLGIAILVLLAGCAGVSGTVADGDSSSPEVTGTNDLERSIEVTAEGEASAEPDRATVLLAVESAASDAGTVRSDLAESDGALRSALYDWGLSEDDVRTERYDIRQTREMRPDANRSEYVGVHVYAVSVDDVDAVGEVIDVAVDAGADGVRQVTFGLSDERADELRSEALGDAMDNAHAEADTLAANADLEVTGVYTVSTTNVRTIPYAATALAAEADDASGAPRTGIEAGDVDVSVSIRVVFGAERA
ncbi:SIMPL domain-containing protein [Halorubrum halodurans]|uniref:SIMPL domain-containing protein n=1 Tax=Halorubrum halodurans TaxID=1383851 RepID=A0A256IHR3_9EURY|nr:SIMPL domain-containing protein [Halorubrum halodurans]OYR56070.1 SIMPL domain-containing protein [Halorubrum halodurans]